MRLCTTAKSANSPRFSHSACCAGAAPVRGSQKNTHSTRRMFGTLPKKTAAHFHQRRLRRVTGCDLARAPGRKQRARANTGAYGAGVQFPVQSPNKMARKFCSDTDDVSEPNSMPPP